MPTLNEIRVMSEYNLVLKFHDSRPPSDQIATRIGNSLFEARRVMGVARSKFIEALNTGKGSDLVNDIIDHHFSIDVTDTTAHQNERNAIINVIKKTHEGLNGIVTLSDLFHRYTWNEYDTVLAQRQDDQRRERLERQKRKVGTRFTEQSATQFRPATIGEEGYVKAKQNAPAGTMGSIHIEFSLAANYPRSQMARIIIHEATHKFAQTQDHAYTQELVYEQLTPAQRASNADSYAYAAISLCYGTLIKDFDDAFRVVPQYGAPQRESYNISLKGILKSMFSS